LLYEIYEGRKLERVTGQHREDIKLRQVNEKTQVLVKNKRQ